MYLKIRFGKDVFTKEDENLLCKALYSENGKWYTSLIKKIDSKSMEAEIMYLGYNDTRKLSFLNLRKLPRLPDKKINSNKDLCYFSSQENRLLIGKITKSAGNDTYKIACKFRENVTEVVRRGNINTKEVLLKASELKRLANNTFYESNMFKVEALDQKEVLTIPKQLRINAADDEKTKKLKKKRIKKIKNEYKKRADERQHRQRQSAWSKFRDAKKNSYFNKSKITAKEGSKKIAPKLSNYGGGIHLRRNRFFKKEDY